MKITSRLLILYNYDYFVEMQPSVVLFYPDTTDKRKATPDVCQIYLLRVHVGHLSLKRKR